MTKTIIYSDFDGVFNIPQNPQTVVKNIQTVGSKYLESMTQLAYQENIVNLFNQLHETGHFKHIWHTTWNHYGNILEATKLIGLKNLTTHSPALLNHQAGGKKEWTEWKANYIIQQQTTKPTPFIWIDDFAPQHWKEHVIENTTAPNLIIQPIPEIGLTVEHINEIINWQTQLIQGGKQ